MTVVPTKENAHIDIWQIVHEESANATDVDFLSAAERDQIADLSSRIGRETRAQWLSARRRILAQYLSDSPSEISFAKGAFGRPELPESSLSFSSSHAAGLSLLAVCRTHTIGIDAERFVPFSDVEGVAGLAFSSAEKAAISAAHADRRLHEFYRIWTRKEAALKAFGTGFQMDPRTISVLGPKACRDDGTHIAILSIQSFPGAAIAVAFVLGSGASRRWSPILKWHDYRRLSKFFS